MTINWDGAGASDERHQSADRVYATVTEEQRRAMLKTHTDLTLALASAALLDRWKWRGRIRAGRILLRAAPKYVRLGGDLNPWAGRVDVPADWEIERAARMVVETPTHERERS